VLSQELPRLKVFCTLSPIPGFTAWLSAQLKAGATAKGEKLALALTAVARALGEEPARVAQDPATAAAQLAPLKDPLLQLCAAYLLQRGAGTEAAQDPVARFHLNNGAQLERVNWLADPSKKGLRESLGMMVNYLYVPRAIPANHQKFVDGEIVASRRVRALGSPG
jgi:malonyl-CoA decarboxylase